MFAENNNSKFMNLFDENGHMKIYEGMRFYKKTEEQNNMVRLWLKLKETVNEDSLSYAAVKTMERHRTFRLVVKNDGKCYYLEDNQREPVVHKNDSSRYVVGTADNNGHLTRIGYGEDTITIDFFHGTSDGIGVYNFARTLLYFYFKHLGKITEEVSNVVTEATLEDSREYADCFLFVEPQKVNATKKYEYERAFQLPDKRMDCPYECNYSKIKVNALEFESFMRSNGSSRSGVFAYFINTAIAKVNPDFADPVVCALAVNARGAYGAEITNRCCVATVPVWYDHEIQNLPLGEALKKSRLMIVDGATKDNVTAAALGNIKFNQSLEERFSTLAEKRAFACEVNKRGGVKYTYGLSYVGEFSVCPEIDKYIEEVHTVLCANTIPLIVEITKFAGYYNLSYCSHFENDLYMDEFLNELKKSGISYTVEKVDNFKEPLAVF